MGTGLEMKVTRRVLTATALCLSLLSACGNDSQSVENVAAVKGAKLYALHLLTGGKVATVDNATVRAGLEEGNQPIWGVKVDKLHYINFMAPYGINGPVQTWASNTYESISLKDDILIATRGFGPDIMSAIVPSLSQVRSARGLFHRVYYYLDGADQPQRVDFDCSFAPAASETVAVLDRTYAAHRVNESCINAQSSFENAYWFDPSGSLRQSIQYVSSQAASMQLQRVID